LDQPPVSLRLRAGDAYPIRLPGLGTVGYEWTVTIEGDQGAVSVAETEAAPPPGGDIPGQSREDVFVLTAREHGHAVVHFAQRRPFEPDRPPRDVRDFEVQID
jgi:predicted secreted protein